MSDLSQKFKDLIDKMDLALTDFTTLDVVTIGGDIKTIIKDDGKFIKPVDLLKNYDSAKSTIRIDAFSHIDFDQDVIQFYREGLTEQDLAYKLHQQAVDSSKTARQAALNFVKEALK